jgi:hypothetical protein
MLVLNHLLLSIFVAIAFVSIMPKAITAQPSEITESKSSSKKIADGDYWGSVGMFGYDTLEVKGNQYRIKCGDCGPNPNPPFNQWKPLSELKYVRQEVLYARQGLLYPKGYQEHPLYWCSEKAPNWTERPKLSRQGGYCNSNGWKWN